MKIIFLNVWNFRLTHTIEKFIQEHAQTTDVFCFQEAGHKTKWFCKSLLKDFQLVSDYKYIEVDPVTYDEEFPQATYIHKNIEIIETKTLLAEYPDTGLALHTKIKHGDKVLSICNVHGVSKPGNKLDTPARVKQSQQIISFYKNFNEPIIIGGDFNLDKGTGSVNTFSESGYKDLIKTYNIQNTRNKYVWDKYPDSKQYYSDFAFSNALVKIKSFEATNAEVSDHEALIAELDV